jgi:signal transduction histidine kinase
MRVKERTAELQTANEELKIFAYTISHDLRAPLVNIKGFAGELNFALDSVQTVLEAIWPDLNEEQQLTITRALKEDIPEALGFIDTSVTRMNRLVSAILKLSRLGRRELNFEPIDMNALVQTILESLAHQIEQGQVKVAVGSLPNIVADRTSMEQIIGNLLTNAVTYLDPDRPGEIEIAGERNQNETIFHVQDNGHGIAESDMNKVFELFRRAGNHDAVGEGMGLAYVRTLVRRHGGQIWCQSKLGMGTTFTFTVSDHLKQGDDLV